MTGPFRIPLSAPDVSAEDIEAVAEVLRTPYLSLGPRLKAFEDALAAAAEAPYAVALSSGTSGLHLGVRALGISEGDEVVVPSFTFVAAANAIVYERARPVFVDVEPLTLNLDPTKVEEAVTPKTRAILAVHTFGCPAEMGALQEIAARRGLLLFEDACEALGASYEGRRVGALGAVGVFAFYPNKQITTGEGGAIVTRDAELAGRVASLRNQGRGATGEWLEHTEIGYNYRLSDIACALGASQLARLGTILARRESVARGYDERLRARGELILPLLAPPRRRTSWFVYVVRLASGFSPSDRDAVRDRLRAEGIACGRYFGPVHLQPAYRPSGIARRMDLSVTESEAGRCLALPFFNGIKEAEQDQVCEALGRALDALSR